MEYMTNKKKEDNTAVFLGMGMIGVWIISAMLSMCAFGVAIWAVIKLVNHFTG
jgi:hypothetical protein